MDGSREPSVDPAAAGAVTVADALALPALQRGLPEVVAGADGLTRPLRWVHAGEVPNIAALLSGGELLLTTGMGIGADAGGFVADLAARGVAALVIELGSSLPVIPEAMRSAAQDAGLPLVALRREVAFVRVTEAIHTELVNRQYGLLRSGEAIGERLIAVMLDGRGLPELLATLSEIVGNPVFLQSAGGRLLYHAGRGDDLDAFEDAGAGAGVAETVPMGPASRPGRLIILPTRRPASELDAIALRHAAGIVALALLRAREEDELIARERGNLLAELADGTVDPGRAARQAESMGFRPQSGALLALAISEHPPSTEPLRAALLADLRRELDGRATPILCGGRGGEGPLLALAAIPGTAGDRGRGTPGGAEVDDEARRATAELVADVVNRVWARRRPGTRTVVAVDGPADWRGAGAALTVAVASAAAAAALPERAWYDARDTELERLLAALRGTPELAGFVRRALGPLLDHDRRRALALTPTLEALCAHGGHKAEAARELHLHRQALYHRIAKIEGLLGVDLSDPARLTTLSVALRARPYLAP